MLPLQTPSDTHLAIELLLIRHGETAWNAERRLQGHSDIPLNQTGQQQAEALAAALQTEHLDAIISSDLLRARQTAQAIADLQGMDLIIKPEWRERCFGGFEGEYYDDLAAKHPIAHAAWKARDVDAPFPLGERAGETIRQFHQRISSAAHQLSQSYSTIESATRQAPLKIALIAHGGVLECMYRLAHQLPLNAPRQAPMLNASINRLSITKHEFRMMSWGDVAHLENALDEL